MKGALCVGAVTALTSDKHCLIKATRCKLTLTVNLIGLAEYGVSSNDDEMVVVRISDTEDSSGAKDGSDLYVSFNRAIGMNEGTSSS